ncbi:TIGR02679 family protein [Aromatoleum aromaticum]|uniref:TIGR02679 family protein n=1 Tax=Aromatoleum aromaticum TaxID=551760 RepID=UPI0014592F42|nr:TIGR02679 family protein [Aromatoleum aromaticum]NMG55927.1 TIGR02679 family protein [Aromatoleum aromaticum]
MDPRLQRLLGGHALAGLRKRLRQRYERGASTGVLRLGALNEAEHAALAALAGRPARHVRSMQINVAEIDTALARAGLAASLHDALEQLDGPIIDLAARRLQLRSQWQELVEDCEHPGLRSALQTSVGLGLLKRVCGSRPEAGTRLMHDADRVLRRLPAAGIPRAQLAVAALGDAHGLDAGSPVATLVLTALRHGAAAELEGERTRELWAAAGVLVNELARPALALNLPGPTGAEPGEPAYLSLRRLLRSPSAWAVTGRPVFVCENPNLLAIAADQLGPNCAPLVCTDGMPAAAQRVLLAQLRAAGAMLHYHGDFDWPGLRIGNQMVCEHDARPWRFSTLDYRAAVADAPRPGRTLDNAAVSARWDDTLADAMLTERLAIDEEGLADVLLDDLRH